MYLTAIDPGTKESALVNMMEDGTVLRAVIEPNERIAEKLRGMGIDGETHLAIEWIEAMGMSVGKTTFETVYWVGRFLGAYYENFRGVENRHTRVYRREVKLELCGVARAKDPNIRQALIDLYGGSKERAIGKKTAQGPLYGFKSHLWSALAVGVTHLRTRDPHWKPLLPRRAA